MIFTYNVGKAYQGGVFMNNNCSTIGIGANFMRASPHSGNVGPNRKWVNLW